MRRRGTIALPAMLLLLALSPAARGEAPSLMHYQGVLADDAGLPVSDTLAMTFHLYEDTLAASIWTAAIGNVPVLNGFYEVYLDVEGVAFDLPYWLGIEVDGSALGPMKPLASVPYAMRSAMTRVEAGDGLDGTSDSMRVALSLADGGVTADKIGFGAVTTDKIGLGAVTKDKIGLGAVTKDKIGFGAVTGAKIADRQLVRALNGMTDYVTFLEGNNISFTQADSTLTINASLTGGAADDDWVVTGDDLYSLPAGNVGVGTTTPGEKLDVTGGSIRTDGKLISTVGEGTPPLRVESSTLVAGLNADQLDGVDASDFAASGHGHDGAEITSGTIDFNRLPVGSTSGTVAEGNHGHDAADVTSGVFDTARLPVGPAADEVAAGNHTHPDVADDDWTVSGSDMYSGVAGNVGIGDSSPTRKLDVNGGIGVEGGLSARSVTGIGLKDSSGKIGVWVEEGAEVGIGTPTPAEMLHVYNGGSHSNIQVETGIDWASSAIRLKTSGSSLDWMEIEKGGPTASGTTAGGIPLASLSRVAAGATAGPLLMQVIKDTCMYFATDNAERMRITSTGRVGIGTGVASKLLDVAGSAVVRGSLYVGTALSTNNDAIFFDSGTSESFEWDETFDRFDLSDGLAVDGPVSVGMGSVLLSSEMFNTFTTAPPVPFSLDMENSGDIYAQDDIEVGDDLHVGDNLTVGGRYNYDDDRILFDEAATAETLFWDNSEGRFQFSRNLAIDGLLWGGEKGPAYGDTATYNALVGNIYSGPSGGDMSTGGDLFIGFDLEAGSDIYYSGTLTDVSPAPRLKSGGSAEPVTVVEARDLLGRLNPKVYRYMDEEEGREPIERTKIGFDPAELPDLVTTPDKRGYRPIDLMAVLSMIIREQQATIEALETRVSALEESR